MLWLVCETKPFEESTMEDAKFTSPKLRNCHVKAFQTKAFCA